VNKYKLLTPGPLTTTETVKQEMLFDHCTWDDDYKNITQNIRSRLLKLAHVTPERYTSVLMQGSGTFGVESVLSSTVGNTDKLLICSNGAYGSRMAEICEWNRIPYVHYQEPCDRIPSAEKAARFLDGDAAITHIAMVHCETTTGILNDAQAMGTLARERGKTFILDAMSSFGGMEIPVADWNIDFLISSANKCIQGVPGFSFILASREKLAESKGKARNLSLNLYDQWEAMERDGKWRFTSPTHTVLAFSKALDELEAEGGISARSRRYTLNNRLLIDEMEKLDIHPFLGSEHQSPIITTFLYPEWANFRFSEFYRYIKDRGYVIYPGKLTEVDTFRIGNIGEIYPQDIEKLTEIICSFFTEHGGLQNGD
jgi:2-aminoethylphosphonate--pyruvate transaminase